MFHFQLNEASQQLLKTKKEGICLGLVMLWEQALFCEQTSRFFSRLSDIFKLMEDSRTTILAVQKDALGQTLTSEEKRLLKAPISLRDYISDARSKEERYRKQKKEDKKESKETKLSDEKLSPHYQIMDIDAFFQGIELFMMPEKFSEFFGKFLTQAQTDQISEYVYSDAIKKRAGVTKLCSIQMLKTEKEMQSFFDKLHNIFKHEEKNRDEKELLPGSNAISIEIASERHIIALTYDRKKQVWLLLDANQLKLPPSTKEITHADIAKQVLRAFVENPEELVGLNMIFKTTGKNNSDTPDKLRQFKNNYKSEPDEMKRETSRGITFAHLVAQSGNSQDFSVLIEAKIDFNKQDITGKTPLIHALENNNEKIIRQLLGLSDLSLADKNKETALHWATIQADEKTVSALIQKSGARSKTIIKRNIAHIAATYGREDLLSQFNKFNDLLFSKDEYGITPIMLAAEKGHFVMMKELIKRKENINEILQQTDNYGNSLLHFAVRGGNRDIIKFLIEKRAAPTVLNNNKESLAHMAARYGRTELLPLITKEINLFAPNKKEQTALMLAVMEGYTDDALTLLSHYKESKQDINKKDETGKTVLHYAVMTGNIELAFLLIADYGADFRATDNSGNSLFHIAAGAGRRDLFLFLQNLKLDCDAKNNSGQTPLMLAVERNQIKSVATLIENFSVDINASAHNGQTALYMTLAYNNFALTKLLLEKRANPLLFKEQKDQKDEKDEKHEKKSVTISRPMDMLIKTLESNKQNWELIVLILKDLDSKNYKEPNFKKYKDFFKNNIKILREASINYLKNLGSEFKKTEFDKIAKQENILGKILLWQSGFKLFQSANTTLKLQQQLAKEIGLSSEMKTTQKLG